MPSSLSKKGSRRDPELVGSGTKLYLRESELEMPEPFDTCMYTCSSHKLSVDMKESETQPQIRSSFGVESGNSCAVSTIVEFRMQALRDASLYARHS